MKGEKIKNNILDLICDSPVVRLNKIPASEGIKCEILAKCEFLLPGGSCKDRIAKRMIEDAEKKGLLKSGSTIIEPTSGNTGIGLAMVASIKGYDVILTMPNNISKEKEDILNALGATVIRTPSELPYDDPNSSFGVARALAEQIPNSVILDQYSNLNNSLVHYEETAEEIWNQCEGKLDYVVVGVGTGGTISGMGKNFKEKNPNIKIIGVDPVGSILAFPDDLNEKGIHKYEVEGIGYDFIPKNCDRSVIDQWIKVDDKNSFRMGRRLIKDEGLLIGGSSGSCVYAAIQIAKNLPENSRVLVVLVDGIRNYITKFLNDDWMLEHDYIDFDEYDELQKTSDMVKSFENESLISELELNKVIPVSIKSTLNEVLEQFTVQDTDCLPVINEFSNLTGLISKKIILNALCFYISAFDQTIEKIIIQDFRKLKTSNKIRHLQKAFNRHSHVLILGEDENTTYICEPQQLVSHFLKKNK